jgi:hypothetical protein
VGNRPPESRPVSESPSSAAAPLHLTFPTTIAVDGYTPLWARCRIVPFNVDFADEGGRDACHRRVALFVGEEEEVSGLDNGDGVEETARTR